MPSQAPGQDQAVAAKNESFFADNADYAQKVASMETYRRIREAIDAEVKGFQSAIDIGNGGVFDYDTSLVERIVAVDLVPEPEAALPGNVTYKQGDALNLPEPDGAHDLALMVMLFHHLTGATAEDLRANSRAALAEAARVLKPGGSLLVVESCVPPWFYAVEKPLFKPLAMVARTRFLEHPPTLQLPPDTLRELVAEHFTVERVEPIPVGRWILQFGKRWPTALTPARPWLIRAAKAAR